jgi:hypothetical protein
VEALTLQAEHLKLKYSNNMSNCNDTKPVEVSNIIKADVNFTVLQGDTFDAVVTFKDSEGKPLNFTGATLVMYIKDDSDITVATLSAGSEFIVFSNIVTFNYITSTLLVPDTYFYDLQCTFANGLRKTLIGGKYKVQKQITTA